MKKEETSIIGILLNKDKLKITCTERKYKVSDSNVGFFIVAKKEFGEDATKELLNEDVELKVLLDNYEITEIMPMSRCEDASVCRGLDNGTEKGVTINEKRPIRSAVSVSTPIESIMTKRHNSSVGNLGTLVKSNNRSTSKDVRDRALKRRELFDSLNLTETFVIGDYKKALIEKGVNITNSAMPYDDLRWLEEQGKVERLQIGEDGHVKFTIKKKEVETAE